MKKLFTFSDYYRRSEKHILRRYRLEHLYIINIQIRIKLTEQLWLIHR